MTYEECFKFLEVDQNVSEEEIKKAYRKKAFELHPDRNNGNDEQFKVLQQAYDTINKRKQNNFDFGHGPDYSPDFDFPGFGGFDFRDFIRNHGESRPPSKDSDVRITVDLNVEQIKNGKTFGIKYNKSKQCDSCNGEGGKEKETCPDCRGGGYVHQRKQVGNMVFSNSSPCPKCQGKGISFKQPCNACNSQGYIVISEQIIFEIKERK